MRTGPAQSAQTLLEVRNLHTWFRADGETVRAVDGTSFHIEAGETFCLVGESGSGKSVSALSVIGLLPADLTERCDGEALFRLDPRTGAAPRNLLQLPEDELMQVRGGRIAMIFQEPMTSLNPYSPSGIRSWRRSASPARVSATTRRTAGPSRLWPRCGSSGRSCARRSIRTGSPAASASG